MKALPVVSTLLAGALLASAASATVMLPLTVEQMTEEAIAVVRGEVVEETAAWDEGRKRIYTHTKLRVLDALHAQVSLPEHVVVKSLGGEVGEIGMKVAGTPQFEPGEEVVVFLRPDPVTGGEFQVIGMSQGKYSVERKAGMPPMAIPSLEGLAFVKKAPDGVLRVADDDGAPHSVVALSALRARVVAAAQAVTPTSEVGAPSAPVTPAPAPTSPKAITR